MGRAVSAELREAMRNCAGTRCADKKDTSLREFASKIMSDALIFPTHFPLLSLFPDPELLVL